MSLQLLMLGLARHRCGWNKYLLPKTFVVIDSEFYKHTVIVMGHSIFFSLFFFNLNILSKRREVNSHVSSPLKYLIYQYITVLQAFKFTELLFLSKTINSFIKYIRGEYFWFSKNLEFKAFTYKLSSFPFFHIFFLSLIPQRNEVKSNF